MDTENFILRRHVLLERLGERRSRDLSSYPFQIGNIWGVKMPIWLRWGLSLVPNGGLVSRLMQVALPLAVPFIFRKQAPLVTRLFDRIFPSKS